MDIISGLFFMIMVVFLPIMILSLPFILLDKLLLSDFFYNKTGIKTYVMWYGKKRYLDKYALFITLGLISTIIGGMGYYVYYLTGLFAYFKIAALYDICLIYIGILIYLRKKFFFYIDEEKKEEDRVYPIPYIIISMICDVTINVGIMIIYALYRITHGGILIFVMIILVVLLHLTVFPDYINKVLPIEIRTSEGLSLFLFLCFFLWAIIMRIILIIGLAL